MSDSISLWMAAICCLYFSFLKMFSYFAFADFYFVLSIILISATIYWASKMPEKKRFWALLLLAVPFLYASCVIPGTEILYEVKNEKILMPLIPKCLVVSFPVFLAVLLIFHNSLNMIYWKKRKIFIGLLPILIVEVLFGVQLQFDIKWVMPYIIMFFVCGTCSLNFARFGNSIDVKCRSFYASSLVIFAGISAVISGIIYAIYYFFEDIIDAIFLYILTPIGYAFSSLVRLVMRAAEVFKYEVPSEKKKEEILESMKQAQAYETEQAIDCSESVVWSSIDQVMRILFIICVLIVLGYMIYFFVEMVRTDYSKGELQEEISGTTTSIQKRKGNKHHYTRKNQDKMRKYYQKHMHMLKKSGYSIERYSTSEDICEEGKLHFQNNENEERIRELYRKARYSDEAISDEEVKEMKKLI